MAAAVASTSALTPFGPNPDALSTRETFEAFRAEVRLARPRAH